MLTRLKNSLSSSSHLASYLSKTKLWLAGSTTIFAAIAFYPSATFAQTAFPSTANLQFQTSGRSRPATIGDWYTTATSNSTDRIHRFNIDITQAELDAGGGTVTITINDAESNGATDEVNGAGAGATTCLTTVADCDPTQFSLRAANGTTILQGPTTVAADSPNGSTVTFTITAPGSYQVTSVTGAGPISGDNTVALNDDDNTFTITASVTGVLIGSYQGSTQFSVARTTPYSFYFVKAPTAASSNLFLRNFDYDNSPTTIQYISPSGAITTGTRSGDGVWNGTGATINTGGDTVVATPLTDAGIWEIRVSNTTAANQFILEANRDGQRLILFDTLPSDIGNFTITPSGTLSTTVGATVCHPFSVTNNFATNDIINLTTANTAANYTAQLRNAAGTTVLTDTDGNGQVDTGLLTPGQTANYTLCVTPNAGATTPDTTRINAVSFMDTKAGTTNTTLFVDKTTTLQSADLSLTKTTSNASPNVGDNVTFTVTVSNAGTDAATGVGVTDLLPAGLTFVSATPSQGTYDSGTGVWTVGTVGTAVNANTATLQIVATVATAGAKTNTAQVTASAQRDPDSTPNNSVATEDDQASVTLTPLTTDLSITKTDSPDPVIAGANLTYTIAVTNNGPSTATNVTMSDPLPSGTTFQSITAPPGWTCTTPAVGSNGTVSCTTNSFAIGSVNFSLVVRVAPNVANNSSLSNTATVSSTTSDTNTNNNSSSQSTTVRQSADLRLIKAATPASPAVGSNFDYTITVTNDGSSTATNVQVTDQLPPTTQVGVTTGGINTTQGTTTYNAATPNIVWNVGTLAPNASATLTIPATRITATNTVNTAEVTFSDQSDPDSVPGNGIVGEDDRDSVTVPSQSVDLAVSKTVNNATPNVGGNVIFTITVTNPLASGTTATNVGLSDLLPPGLTYQSNTVSTGTYNSSTGVWSIASLSSGTTATLTITATVTSSGAKTNTAQLTALDQADPNSSNNTSSAIVTPNSVPPNLLLVKRITAINGVDVTGFKDGVNTSGDLNNVGTKATEDNDILWPAPNTTSLRGAIHSSTIAPPINFKPGDEVEYTIYFLNNGNAQATNVSICDFVPANQTYISTGYNSSPISADTGGLAGSNYGIAIARSNGATPVKATNASDGDRGQFYTSGFPSSCTGTNSGRGAVVVNIGNVPNATGSGTPANSYGFIRFKAKID